MRRALAPGIGTRDMTLFHLHDRWHGPSTGRFVGRALRRVGAALKTMHGAIAAAKIHRLRNELLLHGDAHAEWARLDASGPEPGAWDNRFPRRPLYLGEKWDS
jgi:hypothetical protein